MLALLRSFDIAAYSPRCYVVATTDAMSAAKAHAFEAEAEAEAVAAGQAQGPAQRRSPRGALGAQPRAGRASAASAGPAYEIAVIPRSREVGQSFRTSVLSTLQALWVAVAVVLRWQPGLVRAWQQQRGAGLGCRARRRATPCGRPLHERGCRG